MMHIRRNSHRLARAAQQRREFIASAIPQATPQAIPQEIPQPDEPIVSALQPDPFPDDSSHSPAIPPEGLSSLSQSDSYELGDQSPIPAAAENNLAATPEALDTKTFNQAVRKFSESLDSLPTVAIVRF